MIFDDDIDWSSPLAEHPLNRDALLWWLPAPSRWGGSTTYDLCQKYNGTLVLGAACTGGRGKSSGAWQFDADARIDSPATLPDPATTFTATGWFRHDSTPGTTIYCECGGRWRIQRSGGNLTLTVPGVADNQFASLPISVAGRWYFFAVSLTGTSATGYLDGASQAITLGTPPSSGGNLFCLGDRAFSALGIPGQMTDFRLYPRVLGTGEVAFLREQGATGHPALLRRLRRKWFVPAAGPATYTATAALTLGPAALSASGTVATPAYTGTAALTAGNAELAAEGYTLGPIPGNSGTADLLIGHATFAASGTFAAPVYTATAALAAPHATLAASGTVTAPTYAGTAALQAGRATLAASGTVVNPTYAATAALVAGNAELAGTAVFASAVSQATAALAAGNAELAASGTVTAPTYTATAALQAPHATLAASGTVANPTYTATAALVAGHAALVGAATFAAAVTLAPPLVRDALDFDRTQDDAVSYAWIQGDAVNYVETGG